MNQYCNANADDIHLICPQWILLNSSSRRQLVKCKVFNIDGGKDKVLIKGRHYQKDKDRRDSICFCVYAVLGVLGSEKESVVL
eukprot:c20736_g1_i1 orf=45-293(+)